MTTMQCRSHSRRRTIQCLFVTACSMDQYAEEKRTEKNLIVRSGISEAETTNNKRLRSTFCIEAIQTRSIAWPLCDSRASCLPCLVLYQSHTKKSSSLPSNMALAFGMSSDPLFENRNKKIIDLFTSLLY